MRTHGITGPLWIGSTAWELARKRRVTRLTLAGVWQRSWGTLQSIMIRFQTPLPWPPIVRASQLRRQPSTKNRYPWPTQGALCRMCQRKRQCRRTGTRIRSKARSGVSSKPGKQRKRRIFWSRICRWLGWSPWQYSAYKSIESMRSSPLLRQDHHTLLQRAPRYRRTVKILWIVALRFRGFSCFKNRPYFLSKFLSYLKSSL